MSRSSMSPSKPRASRSATTFSLACLIDSPWYTPADEFSVPSEFKILIIGSPQRSPTS